MAVCFSCKIFFHVAVDTSIARSPISSVILSFKIDPDSNTFLNSSKFHIPFILTNSTFSSNFFYFWPLFFHSPGNSHFREVQNLNFPKNHLFHFRFAFVTYSFLSPIFSEKSLTSEFPIFSTSNSRFLGNILTQPLIFKAINSFFLLFLLKFP